MGECLAIKAPAELTDGLQQLIRVTASGCSTRASHKVAQGHGGGEAVRGGAAVLGGPGTGIPAFLCLRSRLSQTHRSLGMEVQRL